jgi:chemotaxis signal transduction protein
MCIGIPIRDVRGVAPAAQSTLLPGSPSAISGLAYFHGGIEAVIDLGLLWNGYPIKRDSSARFILVEVEGMRGVLLIDNLVDMFDTPEADVNAASQVDSEKLAIKGELKWRDGSVPLFSASVLFHNLLSQANL